MRRQLIIAGFTVLACGIVLGLLMVVAQVTRLSLMTAERYLLPVRAIDTAIPPGQDREAFLAEVRYYGQLPDPLPLLDQDLPKRLEQAFARHPWVEEVKQVQIGPGRRIHVRSVLRMAVLAVRSPEGTLRAVDRSGILLPRGADTLGLPLLAAPSSPQGPGRPWGDPHVEVAARVAHLLAPHQDRWQLNHFAWKDDGLQLRKHPKTGPVVLWGAINSDHDARLARLIALSHRLETEDATIDLRE